MVDRKSVLRSMSLAAVLLSTSLMGCADLGETFVVGIDPSFSASWQTQIENGINDWNQKVQTAGYPLHVSYYVGGCSLDGNFQQGTICIHPATKGQLSGKDLLGQTELYQGLFKDSTILLATDVDYSHRPQDITMTVIHELGHAFGLLHTQKNTAMCYTDGCQSSDITAMDVNQYAYIRGYTNQKMFTLEH